MRWLVLALPVFLAACLDEVAESPREQLASAAARVSSTSFGSPSYWLDMRSTASWDRTLLIFGYVDNRSVCEELRLFKQQTTSGSQFRCTEVE